MDYKIVPELKGCMVSLALMAKIPFTDNYSYIGSAIGIFDVDEESSSVGLKKAMKEAYNKWGIRLAKHQMNVIPIDKTA